MKENKNELFSYSFISNPFFDPSPKIHDEIIVTRNMKEKLSGISSSKTIPEYPCLPPNTL